MRVLVVHNRYSSRVPSGENLAVDDEVRWLREAGVEVVRHEVSNDELISPGVLGRARDGVESMWSPSAGRRFDVVLRDHRPDVVHVHNLFPLLTGSVPAAAHRRGIPVVWTVHNRRVRCVAGGNFREDAMCTRCRPGWRVPGLVHGCYAGSTMASGLVTVSTSLFGASVRRRHVTAIAISADFADWIVDSAGLDRRQVRVKYNGVAGPKRPPGLPAGRPTFLFLGRLSEYKGVRLLLDAWRRADLEADLRIVGDGDLADVVRDATARDPRIMWDGLVTPDRIDAVIGRANVVVVPSTWEEPFGRSAAEALGHGRPVVTTGRGGLSEIVDSTSGWVTGTDPDAMAQALTEATDEQVASRRGEAARRRWQRLFSPEATTERLLEIYRSVASETGRRTVSGRPGVPR